MISGICKVAGSIRHVNKIYRFAQYNLAGIKICCMNYALNLSDERQDQNFGYERAEELKEQLTHLAEWKSKAKVQLEHFRSACSLYKFCEIDDLNELLKN